MKRWYQSVKTPTASHRHAGSRSLSRPPIGANRLRKPPQDLDRASSRKRRVPGGCSAKRQSLTAGRADVRALPRAGRAHRVGIPAGVGAWSERGAGPAALRLLAMKLGLDHLTDPGLLPLVEASRAFYANRVPGRGPNSWDELRAIRASLVEPLPSDPAPVEETISAGGRSVRARIHAPTDGPATGVVMEVHGGGFYLGSATASDSRNRQLSDTLGAVVVSVDYRLAPEHPWPAAPDDCETAALWIVENALIASERPNSRSLASRQARRWP